MLDLSGAEFFFLPSYLTCTLFRRPKVKGSGNQGNGEKVFPIRRTKVSLLLT
jgi:hypothetical protein